MQRLGLLIICFIHFIVYYTCFILTISFMKDVNAIPLINRTNPYYERHLEHINSI